MEKHEGGKTAPNLIAAEDGEIDIRATQDAHEDIHELRQCIVDMMQTEMELVQRIKQNEDNIATVNSRIEEFKQLVKAEQHRSKVIQAQLKSSVEYLRVLEDKKTSAKDSKRSKENVAVQGLESRSMRSKHEQLRSHVRRLEEQVKANEMRIGSFATISEELRDCCFSVQDKMDRDEQLDAHRSELQKVRAKRRFINQHSEQLESDMRAASNTHEKLKDDLQVVEFGILKLNSELGALEKDCTRRRVQTLDKVCQLRLLHAQQSKKLKAKQKKYRAKMRTEIVTLKKRVTFVSKELETHLMDIEDTLSSIAPFRDELQKVDARKTTLEAEVQNYEENISRIQEEIDHFDRCKEKFDVAEMMASVALKNDEVDRAVQDLKSKKEELGRLKKEDSSLQTEIARLNCLIEEISIDGIEKELSEADAMRTSLEQQHYSLSKQEKRAEEYCGQMIASTQTQRKQHKRLKAATAKMQKEFRKISIRRDETTRKLESEQKTLRVVEEAEQLAISLDEDLKVIESAHDEKLRALESELRAKDQEWKRRCLEEDTRLKAELQEWCAKVQALEVQIAAP